MTQEMNTLSVEENRQHDVGAPLPFPFTQQTFAATERSKAIEAARVLVVDNLLRDEKDLSEVGEANWVLRQPPRSSASE